MDFYDLKGVVLALADGLHLPNVNVSPIEHPTFRPGRTARFLSTVTPSVCLAKCIR